jgi:hypothetical protein
MRRWASLLLIAAGCASSSHSEVDHAWTTGDVSFAVVPGVLSVLPRTCNATPRYSYVVATHVLTAHWCDSGIDVQRTRSLTASDAQRLLDAVAQVTVVRNVACSAADGQFTMLVVTHAQGGESDYQFGFANCSIASTADVADVASTKALMDALTALRP